MEIAYALLELARTALVFLAVITVLVAVHELGHFWFARMFGMEVNAFAVMMGGVRRTDLRPYLERPLLPVWAPVSASLAAILVFIAGAALKLGWLELAALGALAAPLPLWSAWRLEKLYHLPAGAAARTMSIAWAASLLMLMAGTRGTGLTPHLVLGVLIAGSAIGVLLLYYRPVSGKSEETPMGHGRLELNVAMDEAEASALGLPAGSRRVETVPVMFRPLLWFKDKKGTEFSFLLLPLGGFAAIKGMHAKEDGSEVHVPNGFYSKPAWQRLLVLFAGPLFSILFGLILLTGVYATEGKRESTTIVEAMSQDSPAAKAGIRPGDQVSAINGKPVGKFAEMVAAIRDRLATKDGAMSGLPTDVEVVRNGQTLSFKITPLVTAKPAPVMDANGFPTAEFRTQARLGIATREEYVQKSVPDAAVAALAFPVETINMLKVMLSRADTAAEAVSGPITVAQVSQSAASRGLGTILMFAAALSISLGIMNLLPIPPLDGGQMVVAFVEMFRRRRLPFSTQNALASAGVFFVIALTLLAVVVDLGRQASRNTESGGSGLVQSTRPSQSPGSAPEDPPKASP